MLYTQCDDKEAKFESCAVFLFFFSLHKLDHDHRQCIFLSVLLKFIALKRLHSLCYLHRSPDGLCATEWRIFGLADTQEALILRKKVFAYIYSLYLFINTQT